MRKAAFACEREVLVLRVEVSWDVRSTFACATEDSFDMVRLWRCFDSERRVRMEATVALRCSRIGFRPGISGAS